MQKIVIFLLAAVLPKTLCIQPGLTMSKVQWIVFGQLKTSFVMKRLFVRNLMVLNSALFVFSATIHFSYGTAAVVQIVLAVLV